MNLKCPGCKRYLYKNIYIVTIPIDIYQCRNSCDFHSVKIIDDKIIELFIYSAYVYSIRYDFKSHNINFTDYDSNGFNIENNCIYNTEDLELLFNYCKDLLPRVINNQLLM